MFISFGNSQTARHFVFLGTQSYDLKGVRVLIIIKQSCHVFTAYVCSKENTLSKEINGCSNMEHLFFGSYMVRMDSLLF